MNHKSFSKYLTLFITVTLLIAIASCNGEKEEDSGTDGGTNISEAESDTTGIDSVKNASLKKFLDPNQNDTARVYAFLEGMFAASLKNDYKKVGPMIAYVGMDSTRVMDSYNVANAKEKENVQMTMEAINLWLTDKSIYYFDDTWIETVGGYRFIVQEVVFGYNSYYFIVFDRGDKLLLSNISLDKPAMNQSPI